MKKRLWFRAKRYGWGWMPATWEGWIVTLGYCFVLLGTGYYLSSLEVPTDMDVVTAVLVLVFATLAIMLVAYRTGEKPRWRWGGKD